MVNSRQKGAAAEREFIALMQQVAYIVLHNDAFVLKRNLEQYQDGGCDIMGAVGLFDFLAIEIKRCEKLQIEKWWKQACTQADNCAKKGKYKIPVLAYRQSNKAWRVRLITWIHTRYKGMYRATITISIADFLKWYACCLDAIAANATFKYMKDDGNGAYE